MVRKAALTITAFLFLIPGTRGDKKVLLHENFNTLTRWKPFYFRGIDRHSRYSTEKKNEGSYLRAEADSSASALVMAKTFNVYRYPLISWRWKITGVHPKGNARVKKGDDYPFRVYILFTYKPSQQIPLGVRIKYRAIKTIYGRFPPHSSLNYIWANRPQASPVLSSPYSDRVKLFILRTGPREKNSWKSEKRNILEDYLKSFGKMPPAEVRIAVMADGDNTKGSVTSFIDELVIEARTTERQ